MLAEPIDDTGIYVVDRTDYAEFAFRDEVANLFAVGKRRGDRLEDILADGERNEILIAHARVSLAGALNGGNDVVNEAGDASVYNGSRGDGAHRAALGVSQDDHERRVEMARAVLGRTDLIGVRDISCDAHDKQVTDASVEQALKRNARVGAADDGRHRRLSGAGLEDSVHARVRVLRRSSDEARVAFFEGSEDLVGGWRNGAWGGDGGGADCEGGHDADGEDDARLRRHRELRKACECALRLC